MTVEDVPVALRLNREAGWNQRTSDWKRFLAMQPEGCFVAELEEVAVGTAVTCVFGPVAWIAMVLVAAEMRGRGVGKALLRHVLAVADGLGAKTVRLDATPLGQPLYEQLGFARQYAVTRFAGQLPDVTGKASPSFSEPVADAASAGFRCWQHRPRVADTALVREARQEDYAAILELDHAVTQTRRDKFLLRLFAEWPAAVRVVERRGRMEGYLAVRPGSDALQLGPCIAVADAGEALLDDALERFAGKPVYWDLPSDHHSAALLATAAGLHVQRQFVRMFRGIPLKDDFMQLWCSSGPELG